MDDYPGEGQDPGSVNDVSSSELQSTIPDIGMSHQSQLAVWSQTHSPDDSQYANFTGGSQGVVYDTQVTDIVQQAYLQSALVQSDQTADKFNPYQVETGMDKTCVQSDESGNFVRSLDTDRRNYDLLRSKGLEIVHTVVLDDQSLKTLPHHQVDNSYRHMQKQVNEPVMFDNHSLGQDQSKEMQMSQKGMTEYGRVLLKHQQNQYISHGQQSSVMSSPPKMSKVDLGKQMHSPQNSPENMPPPRGIKVNPQQEVDLFDQEWGDQTRLLLFNLMTEHKLCDAAISTGKYTIKLHKLVLAMSSEKFASFLTDGMDSRCATISVPGNISESTLKVFVTFLYLGKVRVSLGILKEIKALSKIFEIHNLEHLCYGIMIKNNIPTYIGTWPKLKVSFDKSFPCLKRDQNVGTEESYFKAMSEMSKSPLGGRGKGKLKKGLREKMPKALPKAAGHRYGTRGASSALAPEAEEEDHIDEDNDFKEESDSEELINLPTIKQGPKGRFSARNAARARKKGKSDKELANSLIQKDEKKNQGVKNSFEIVVENAETGISSANTDRSDYPDSLQQATNLPMPTLRGRKQKLLQSVEMSNVSTPVETCKTDSSIIVTPSIPDMGTTNSNPHLPSANSHVSTLPASENYPKVDNSVSALTGIKKGKKGRARRPLPTHVAVRPPPKKRAKMELNRLTLENNEEYDLPMIFLSPSPSPAKELEKPAPPRITRPKSKKRKRWPKADVTCQLANELERMANNIVEEGERQFKCELCGNEFVFPKRSVTHLLNTHQVAVDEVISNVVIRRRENSPKVCDICGYKTKDPNFYYIHYHKYFRHGIPLPQGWKPFTCDICGKECFTKFQLKDHKLIHLEETPFVCEVCGQGFKSRTCLNSHVFHRHSDERKHSCPECHKTFKTKTQRLVHMRTHTGEKPFSCPDCPYKSTTRGNMRLHLCNKHKYDADRIKSIMVQLKTLETALDTQKIYMDPGNLEQPVADTSGLADTSLSVADTSLNQTEVPLTLTATAVIDRAVNVIAAEQAMHAILLPLSNADSSSLSTQSITTYSVESTIPLTAIPETQVGEPPNSTSPTLNSHRQHAMSSAQSHFYMQHSPISPPPQSESPHTTYPTATSLHQTVSPLNLQAAQVVTTTLNPASVTQVTSPEPVQTYDGSTSVSTSNQPYDGSTPVSSNNQPYDAAMIQAYYQQQFYPHGY